MTRQTFQTVIVSLWTVLLLIGCSGGGSSQVASGGIGGTGISQGAVTGKGSICINSTKWNTDSAIFNIEDSNSGVESDIKVGMVSTIRGELTATEIGTCPSNGAPYTRVGDATSITFEDLIKGPITSAQSLADGSTGTIEVMNQTVIVDGNTVVVSNGGGLTQNEEILVSGYLSRNANGDVRILATYIEENTSGYTPEEITGEIESTPTPDCSSFAIGGLTVTYNCVTQNGGSPVTAGTLIEAKGTYSAGTLDISGGSLEIKDPGLSGSEDDAVDIEGLVTDISNLVDPITYPTTIMLDGITVQIDAQTEFEGGTITNITLNSRLEIEGFLNASLVLVADEIEFEDNGFKIASTVSAPGDVDTGAGTITMFDLEITTDDFTEFEGPNNQGAGINITSLGDILNGDYLQIEFIKIGSTYIARSIKSDSVDDDVLEGIVEDVTGGGTGKLQILGIDITPSLAPSPEYQDIDDTPLSGATEFENLLTVDESIVEVSSGTTPAFTSGAPGTFTAEKFEVED